MSDRLSDRTTQTPIRHSPAPRQLFQRHCDCGRAKGPSGHCAQCARKRTGIQTRLSINRPGDRYEQEADRMADSVMRLPAVDRSGGSFNGIQPHFQEPSRPVGDERIGARLKGASAGLTPDVGHQPPGLDGGRPLPFSERAYFEPRFGHDFSQVRIHSDAETGYSAQDISARAYTLRDHIVFGPGQYTPATPGGRRLLAHELAHVVQQRGAKSAYLAGLIQRQPVSAPTAREEESTKDPLGEEIKKVAEDWVSNHRKIISDKELERVRQESKNFTTCIDFAIKVITKAVMAKVDKQKDYEQIKKSFIGLKVLIEEEAKYQHQLENDLDRLDRMFGPKLPDVKKVMTDLKEQNKQMWKLIMELNLEYNKPDQTVKEGEQQGAPEPKSADRNKLIKDKKDELDRVIRKRNFTLRRANYIWAKRAEHLSRMEGKVALLESTGKETAAKGFIKPDKPPYESIDQSPYESIDESPDESPDDYVPFSNRPNKGNILFMLQPFTAPYGIKEGTKEKLLKGSFRHVNVFLSKEKIGDGSVEKWHTIDGGEQYAYKREYYIRLRDHMIFTQEPPWDVEQPHYKLFGWIDINKLVEEPKAAPAAEPTLEQETDEYE